MDGWLADAAIKLASWDGEGTCGAGVLGGADGYTGVRHEGESMGGRRGLAVRKLRSMLARASSGMPSSNSSSSGAIRLGERPAVADILFARAGT